MYLSETKMVDQTIAAKQANPLAGYFRQPKLYIKLPSQGKYYPDGALDVSANDEYAVYAMTAKDELIMKTPDALMNGQATVEVIRSCVPAIKDPWSMPSIDLDTILIAIRMATYGQGMDVTATCPACMEQNEYEINLLNYLDAASQFRYESTIPVDPLIVNIRPYNYKEITKTAIRALEQQKIIDIVTDETLSDEVKIEKFGESFVKLTDLTVDVVLGSIESIQTPEALVTDREQIKEFIDNAPADIFNSINTRLEEMKDFMSLKAQEVKCGHCSHEFSFELTLDQTNFFVKGS